MVRMLEKRDVGGDPGASGLRGDDMATETIFRVACPECDGERIDGISEAEVRSMVAIGDDGTGWGAEWVGSSDAVWGGDRLIGFTCRDCGAWLDRGQAQLLAGELGEELHEPTVGIRQLQESIGTWGDQTFPYDRTSWREHGESCRGVLMHLGDEYDELLASFEHVQFPLLDSEVEELAYEAADMAILLFQLAHRVGFDLARAVEEKMIVNRRRAWSEPDERGVVRHVEVGT